MGSTHYRGRITDTSRWRHFVPRDDDIFICTPQKCGTTWTQAIVAMIVFGRVDHGQMLGVVSPWIDATFVPIGACLQRLEAQQHRRFIKTHTPLDGIPFFTQCTYLVVLRDPRDTFFSIVNHCANFRDEGLAAAIFPKGDTFLDWLHGKSDADDLDKQSLDGMVRFFRSYWDYRHYPNVHLFHYSELKNDLRGCIDRIARALRVDLIGSSLDAMARAATFREMKAKSEQYAPESGTGLWKRERDFFASGGQARWKGKLTEQELAAFHARISELLTPEQAAWLVRG